MDNLEILHHRYASALFEIATACRKEEDIMDHLAFLNKTIEKNNRIAKFLYNPWIGDEEKIKFLKGIAKRKRFCDEFVNFLRLLVEKKRLKLIHGVLLRYRDFYDIHKKRIVVFLKSASKLEESQMERLRNILAERFGKEVVIEHSVEPSLMGGLSLKVGDRIYDTSVRTGLLRLREVMV